MLLLSYNTPFVVAVAPTSVVPPFPVGRDCSIGHCPCSRPPLHAQRSVRCSRPGSHHHHPLLSCCMHRNSLLAERCSGAGSDELFELRNHVLAEGSPRIAIIDLLRVQMIERFVVHTTRLVDLDEGVQYEICVGQFLAGFGMHKK